MNLEFSYVGKKELKRFFTANPKVMERSLADEELKLWQEEGVISHPSQYVGIAEKGRLIALFRAIELKEGVVNADWYLDRRYHGKGYAHSLIDCVVKRFKKNGQYKQIWVLSPCASVHVKKVLDSYGATIIDTVEQGAMWRGKLVDYYIFSIEVE